jgi:hypothetical protein
LPHSRHHKQHQIVRAGRQALLAIRQGVKAASKAAAMRHFVAHPKEAIPLVLT